MVCLDMSMYGQCEQCKRWTMVNGQKNKTKHDKAKFNAYGNVIWYKLGCTWNLVKHFRQHSIDVNECSMSDVLWSPFSSAGRALKQNVEIHLEMQKQAPRPCLTESASTSIYMVKDIEALRAVEHFLLLCCLPYNKISMLPSVTKHSYFAALD